MINATPQEKKELSKLIDECVNSMVREQAEKDYRKDVAADLKEKYHMERSYFNQLVKNRYDNSVKEKYDKMEDILEFDEELRTAQRNP